jgi:hypothetical protein
VLQTLVSGSLDGVGGGDGGLALDGRQNAQLNILAVVRERKRDGSIGACGGVILVMLSSSLRECSARTVDIKPRVPFVVGVGCRHVDSEDEGAGRKAAPSRREDCSVSVVAG